MAITHVQGSAASVAGSATTVAITISAVGSGNTVVGAVSRNDDNLTVTITDDKGNTYTNLDTVNDAAVGFCVTSFVLGNITNGPTTITATFPLSEGFRSIVVDEYSGVSAVANPTDGHTGALQSNPVSTSTDAITSGSITTTVNGDLIWSSTTASGAASGTVGTGYTLGERASPTVLISSEYKTQSTSGAVAGTWTAPNTADDWLTFVVALKAAATGDTFANNGQIFFI